MRKLLPILGGLILALSTGANAGTFDPQAHCTACKKLQEARRSLDTATPATAADADNDKILAGFDSLYTGLNDWASVKKIQSGDAKEDFVQQYVLLSDRLMQLSPEPDPVECLGTLYDSDKKLVQEQINKMPAEIKERVMKRLNSFRSDDRPSKDNRRPSNESRPAPSAGRQ